jgi:hypothetical protein
MKLTAAQLKEIKDLLSKEEDVQDALDEMVHDACSNQAANINNQGEDSQLSFLAEGFDDFKYFKAYVLG